MGQADEFPPHVGTCPIDVLGDEEHPQAIDLELLGEIHRFIPDTIIPHDTKEPPFKRHVHHLSRCPDSRAQEALFPAPEKGKKEDKGKGKHKVGHNASHHTTPCAV